VDSWQQREQRTRGLLSREIGSIRKPHGDRLRVALAFPNTYHVGMSNLGFQTAYRLFNESDEAVCERVFLPPRSEIEEALRTGWRLVTLESQTPVSEMDVLAFSVSFEWDYTHVLTLLRLAGLPLYAAERAEWHPLVVIGGATTFLNPEPLAPFADLVCAGDGEVLIPELVRAAASGRRRATALGQLAGEPGMYVPSLVDVRYAPDGTVAAFAPAADTAVPLPVRKAALRAADLGDPPATQVFTPDTEFGSRLLIEVVRGCPSLCRFCWAGYNYLPVRAFHADRILRLAEAARPHASRVGLVSIALCAHPDIERILARLCELGYGISPASLRLDDLTAPIVRLLRESGERTITIAPETGSDRLRRVINKAVTNADILDRADLVFAQGVANLKLYYMVGLPTESDEDLVAIRDLTAAVRGRMMAHARSRGTVGRIVASVNPLVPKPGTAYQWMPMERPAVLERKMRRLRQLTSDLDNVYFTMKSERHSYYQALLSLGDRRVAPVIVEAERNHGQWRAAASFAGVDPEWYIFRDRSTDTLLPWEVIDGSPRRAFLRAEFDRGLRAQWTLPADRVPPESPPSSAPSGGDAPIT
jgi:radical SAM superfamily enzyme YgiQ (UPF0313 family)